MSTLSIIGTGSMAAAIAGRTAQARHTVEVISRDSAKARALSDKLAVEAVTGAYGAVPLDAFCFCSADTGRRGRPAPVQHPLSELFEQ